MAFIIIFLALFAFAAFIIFINIMNQNSLDEQAEKLIEQQFSQENFKKENYHFPIPRIGNGIVLDFDNKRIGIVSLPVGRLFIYDITQIISANIEHKYNTVQTTSSKKGVNVGRAVAGGLLLGGAGAVIGGLSGKSKEITVNNDIYVESIITLNTKQIDNPIVKVNLKIKDRAEKLVAQINLMINH